MGLELGLGWQIGIGDLNRGLRLGIKIGDWLGFGTEDWGLVFGIEDWDLDYEFGLGFEDLDRGLGSEIWIGEDWN